MPWQARYVPYFREPKPAEARGRDCEGNSVVPSGRAGRVRDHPPRALRHGETGDTAEQINVADASPFRPPQAAAQGRDEEFRRNRQPGQMPAVGIKTLVIRHEFPTPFREIADRNRDAFRVGIDGEH